LRILKYSHPAEYLPMHVMPQSLDSDSIVHPSGELVRLYFEKRCAACRAGRCWQHIIRTPGASDVIVHGLNMEN
jgi:hypothetical protein